MEVLDGGGGGEEEERFEPVAKDKDRFSEAVCNSVGWWAVKLE